MAKARGAAGLDAIELTRGIPARDCFIAAWEARPGLLLWVSSEPKEKSAPAAIPALTRPGMGETRREHGRPATSRGPRIVPTRYPLSAEACGGRAIAKDHWYPAT